jgi:hypothetical protein
MSTPNWLRFRAGERAHVVTGMSGPMLLIPCGYAAHGATGVPDKRARKCRTCSRAVRPVSPQEWRKAGHFPKKPPAKPCKKLERARVTLQIILTWAKFRDGAAFHRLDVLRLVEKTLREMK